MNSSIRKVVRYIRVSTLKQQKHGYSIDGQRQAFKSYEKENNLVCVSEFVEAKSGTAAENRDQFQKAVAMVAADASLHLLVWDVDRFARNQRDHHTYLERMNNRVLFVITPEATGMLASLKAMLAEQESTKRSERQILAHAERKRQGKKAGHAANFNNEGRMKGAQARRDAVLNNPNCIQAYAYIKLLRKGDTGWQKVADELNENSYVTSTGGKFYPSSAQRLYTIFQAEENIQLEKEAA